MKSAKDTQRLHIIQTRGVKEGFSEEMRISQANWEGWWGKQCGMGKEYEWERRKLGERENS